MLAMAGEEIESNSMIDKQKFIEFLVSQDVLKFGTFTLNSGRQSPYFFNLGSVSSGAAYARLGAAYADAVQQSGVEFDLIFGPAYKGIPIAVATTLALAERGLDVGMAYNRKEAKDHGEGGLLVGAPLTGRVLMLDDVLTSGKAIRGATELIRAQDAEIAGVVIALDRAEVVAEADQTAVGELAQELGSPVVSIAHVSDVLDYLQRTDGEPEVLQAMAAYTQQYCAF